ncbi:MAG: HPP family protein [Deltaproteobacteria bacterium]|nr:HPP family protein [Deltaproteobacteria bacterium]
MSPTALAIGWAGSFIGILILALINSAFLSRTDNLLLLVGSFGASAVLLFGAPAAPLSQPRNLVGGHVISALVGVTTYLLLGWNIPLAAATAVATAITVMQLTGTLHPPGGATALIAVIGNERVHELGYLYALAPIGLGAMILLVVALITNNSTRRSKYPIKWI